MADRSIFKRYEIKYKITEFQYEALMNVIKPHMREDEHGRSTIMSLYCDTPDNLLIRRSIEHPEYKEKVRLRSYGTAADDDKVFVELKKKYDGVVYKRRLKIHACDAPYLFGGDSAMAERIMAGDGNKYRKSQIAAEIAYAIERYPGLAPAMMICYEREAWYCNYDSDLRITFDRNVRWRTDDLDLRSGTGGHRILPEGVVLMEIKTSKAMPIWLTDALSAGKIYKASFSKYGKSYEALVSETGAPERIKRRLAERVRALNDIREGRTEYGYDLSRAV